MGKFKAFAVFQRVGARKFKLVRLLQFKSADGATYTVRIGFLSDLGSIPRVFWPLLPPSEFPSAYFLHDYLTNLGFISWEDCTKLLKEAIVASGGSSWKAWVICAGVAIWGPLREIKRVLVQKLN